MGDGNTLYFFNNVSWGLGGGTPNYGIDTQNGAGSAGAHFYFFNNTMYSEISGTADCIDAGGSSSYVADDINTIQNNHCITNQNPYWGVESNETWKNQAGSTTQATVQASSTVDTSSASATQGYTISNLFAPTASSNDTVTFASTANSANLTSLCSGNLIPLCSDINGNPRPTSGGWQAGAYAFAAGTSQNGPAAPTNLTASVQ
jgi:hypothetical protein